MKQSDLVQSFEIRKRQHIELALSDEAVPERDAGFDRIDLSHEALPEGDFDKVDVSTSIFGAHLSGPVFVSSMTAGHIDSVAINMRLASVCQQLNILMGVGSQRRQLFDEGASHEWTRIREKYPEVNLMGNIGLSQLVDTPIERIKWLAESIDAVAMIVHTNPLQEVLQKEGTPRFSGGKESLKRLCSEMDIPVILKETGCGFSMKTLKDLCGLGLYAVDVSGFGGTHWGLVEGLRAMPDSMLAKASLTFKNWGTSTVDSLIFADQIKSSRDYRIWASGGIRDGLMVAKSVAMGAEIVGIAGPIMRAALVSEEAILEYLKQVEFELKMAMFCTGSENIQQFTERQLWHQRMI